MEKAKVLFVSQEISPYMEISQMAVITRYLPQSVQEGGKEIRTFMPRFGCVNERRYQLHEVIRLSGMNLIIDDSDHPLIIKVASIQSARMQVYFIDNEEYFDRKFIFRDEKGKFFKDNDERMIFFCRGVVETVRKLGWAPDVVHCHGWFTSLLPLYLKKAFNDDPLFCNSKVVYSVYNDGFDESLNKNFTVKMMLNGINDKNAKTLRKPSYLNLNKLAISMADAIIIGSEKIHPELEKYIKETNKPVLEHQPIDEYIDAYSAFFDELILEEPVFAQ
ncbi:MAG: glycogen/starch synthase [Bacteroidota bacterium]